MGHKIIRKAGPDCANIYNAINSPLHPLDKTKIVVPENRLRFLLNTKGKLFE